MLAVSWFAVVSWFGLLQVRYSLRLQLNHFHNTYGSYKSYTKCFAGEEILLKIGFIEEMITTLDNKEVPRKPFSTIPLIRENTI